MRRHLILLTLAVTGMVVLAFVAPLFVLVSDLARDRAIAAAERDAESLARALSVLTVNEDLATAIDVVGEDRIVDVNGSVILPDGDVVGVPLAEDSDDHGSDDEDLTLAEEGNSFVASVIGGAAVYVPVVTSDETAVVRVFVPDSEIHAGVARSWIILAVLGIVLVALAALVADRLGRSMVIPVRELSETAERLREGDLTARVRPAGPPEIEEVGLEFNRLANQIGQLLQQERETAADLAHRLRTPLTAARLTVDGLDESAEKLRLWSDLDELQRTTDYIIREARRPVRHDGDARCDLGAIVTDRARFWEPLATEQERIVTVSVPDRPTLVAVPSVDIETAIDALIENIMSHTPSGVPFSITATDAGSSARLTIEDGGAGLPEGFRVARGTSHDDSTGLGLDIVRRTVESVDGSLSIGRSETLGGASIKLDLPLSHTP
ncbi:MAG: HAMP domain-containing sensor histidine kinase [Acidimicrobiia bacterium]